MIRRFVRRASAHVERTDSPIVSLGRGVSTEADEASTRSAGADCLRCMVLVVIHRSNGLMLSRVAAPHSGRTTRSVGQERGGSAAGPNERRYVGSCNELGAADLGRCAPTDSKHYVVELKRGTPYREQIYFSRRMVG
jgi:hypothetical protein